MANWIKRFSMLFVPRQLCYILIVLLNFLLLIIKIDNAELGLRLLADLERVDAEIRYPTLSQAIMYYSKKGDSDKIIHYFDVSLFLMRCSKLTYIAFGALGI
jgi:hypothetical protein